MAARSSQPGCTSAFDESQMNAAAAAIRSSLSDALRQQSAASTSKQYDPALRSISEPNAKIAEIPVKLTYREKNYALVIPRPVDYRALRKRIRDMFKHSLNMYYTDPNLEILIPITNQAELDKAVEMIDESKRYSKLRLLLSQRHKTEKSADSNSGEASSSGAYPGRSHHHNHSHSSGRAKSARSRRSSMASDSAATAELAKKIVQVPHKSSASSVASSRISIDYASTSQPRSDESRRLQHNLMARGNQHLAARSHRHSQRSGASKASSSSSSGMVADLDHFSPLGSPRAPVNWRLGRKLGMGTFGTVHLCYDADTGMELAVKQLRVDADDHTCVKKLENEINMLSSCQHERVVSYCGTELTPDVLSIFMEYMSGGSVKDELRTYGALTEPVARKYTRQILEGLFYLHKDYIVHRDIKTANILRDGRGNVKIGDFGSAKLMKQVCVENGTIGADTFAGTVKYMAPEVARGQKYGRRADIWSVGITLIEMLTCSTPYNGDNVLAILYQIVNREPVYKLGDEITDHMKHLTSSLLTMDPAQRPTAHILLKHKALILEQSNKNK